MEFFAQIKLSHITLQLDFRWWNFTQFRSSHYNQSKFYRYMLFIYLVRCDYIGHMVCSPEVLCDNLILKLRINCWRNIAWINTAYMHNVAWYACWTEIVARITEIIHLNYLISMWVTHLQKRMDWICWLVGWTA